MSRAITGYDLPLPPNGYWLPGLSIGDYGWATDLAEQIVPDIPRRKGKVRLMTDCLKTCSSRLFQQAMAEQEFTQSAVLVAPSLGEILSQIFISTLSEVSGDGFEAAMTQWVANDRTGVRDKMPSFDAVVPAGRLRGVFAGMAYKKVDWETGEALRGRNWVSVAIQPPESSDLLEVRAWGEISAVADDGLPRALLNLLAPLTIQTTGKPCPVAPRIVGCDWPLPEDWHWLPPVGQDLTKWSHAIANRFVAQVPRRRRAVAKLATELEMIDLYAKGTRTAMQICPQSGEVNGDATIQILREQTLDDFIAESTEYLADDVDDVSHEVTNVKQFTAEIPAGDLRGHDVFVTVDRKSHEQWVECAIASPGSPDLVKVIVTPRKVGTWGYDLPRYVLNLLQTLTIQTEN